MKKENLENIDWKIIAQISDNGEGFFKTLGFYKYGYGEIIVVNTSLNGEKVAELINTFGKMLLNGEKFDENCKHFIDDSDGKTEFAFSVIYGEYNNGEKWIQLVPYFENSACDTTESFCDSEEDYGEVVYLNNRPYIVLKTTQNETKLCRIDKLVWQTFVDDTLDIFDNSWELGYKDGNYKNCALENLYKIK